MVTHNFFKYGISYSLLDLLIPIFAHASIIKRSFYVSFGSLFVFHIFSNEIHQNRWTGSQFMTILVRGESQS